MKITKMENAEELLEKYEEDEIIDLWNSFCLEFDEEQIYDNIEELIDWILECDLTNYVIELIRFFKDEHKQFYQINNVYYDINQTNDISDFDLDMLVDYMNDNLDYVNGYLN